VKPAPTPVEDSDEDLARSCGLPAGRAVARAQQSRGEKCGLVDRDEGDAVLGGNEVVLVAHGDDDLVVFQEGGIAPLDGGLVRPRVEGGDGAGAGGHPALDLEFVWYRAVAPGHGEASGANGLAQTTSFGVSTGDPGSCGEPTSRPPRTR